MADEIKQIKVGDTTYNIEPYTSYVTLYTKQDDISGRKTFTGGVKISGRYQNSGDDEGLIIGRAANNYAGLCLGDPGGVRSVFYLNPSNSALWRYYNGSAAYDITHPGKAGTIALTSDITTAIGNIIDSEETYKTFKKVAEYIAADKTGTAEMMGRISANETSIKTNQTNIDAHGTRLTGAETNIAENTAEIGKVKTDLSTNYLPLAGGTMTGNIKWGGATQEILSFAPTNADWRGGLKYSWSSNTTIGIWGRHAMSQFVWHAGADFASADVNGTTTKTYDFQIGRSVATGSTIVRTSGDLSVAGGAAVGGSMDANSARISNGLYVGTSITHKEDENLLIGNSRNNDYVEFIEDVKIGDLIINVEDGHMDGIDTISIGSGASASLTGSIAIGKEAMAIGNSYPALAVGRNAAATGQTTIALGYQAKAYTQPTTGSVSGYGAIAIGGWASASGGRAIAIGPCAQATNNDRSLSIGFGVTASAAGTVAIGSYVKADQPGAVAIGHSCCGGTDSVAIGSYAYATGTAAVGINGNAYGPNSVCLGKSSKAGTIGSVAIGYNSYADTGASTIAIGRDCYATGSYCISVGYRAKSAQTGSIAMGYNPTASGVYSIAIGTYAKAYKNQSIVMGYYASATGAMDGNSSIVIGPSAVSYATNTGDPSYPVEMGNTVIGRKASVSGFANVVVGVGDGTRHVSVSGTGNVVIATPQQALADFTGNTQVRSHGGILIGRGSISGSAILIRNKSSSYVEYGAYLGGIGKSSYTGSSYLVLGSPSTNYCYKTSAGSSWTSASDIRDKTDIQSLTGGLEFLSKITPITYVENPRTRYSEDNDKTYDKEAHKLGTKKGVRRIAGVNAQETYAVQQEIYGTDNYGAVVDWSRHDHPDEEEFDRYWVQYERFVPYLIDAVKTLNKKVCELEKEIENLKSS